MSDDKTKMVSYRNVTGGLLCIPILAKDSPLVGAVAQWLKVEDSKTFKCECNADGPVNPSLRVAANAKDYGIILSSEPVPNRPKLRQSREIG